MCTEGLHPVRREQNIPVVWQRKCCLHELGREFNGFRVHFGERGMSEMFVIVQTGNGCFSTLRICSITSSSPVHPWRWGWDNPVGSSPPVLGTLKQRLVALQVVEDTLDYSQRWLLHDPRHLCGSGFSVQLAWGEKVSAVVFKRGKKIDSVWNRAVTEEVCSRDLLFWLLYGVNRKIKGGKK